MDWKHPNWGRILTVLLVILVLYALLYITGSLLLRFTQAIVLFVLGAMAAYILSPLVNGLEQLVRLRWAAIFVAYLSVALGLVALGLLLVTPFIQQAQSLVDNLHNPSSDSLQTIATVQKDATQVRHDLRCIQSHRAYWFCSGMPPAHSRLIDLAGRDITHLEDDIDNLQRGIVSGPSHTRPQHSMPAGRVPPNPEPQTQVPPSYVGAIRAATGQTAQDLEHATAGSTIVVDRSALRTAIGDAGRARNAAATMYHVMSTTPILLIRSQTWLDQHAIRVDLHNKFGEAAQQLSDQGTIILDNSITILSETANILLNITLILIISFYLLNDGHRLLQGGLSLIPQGYRDNIWFFVSSLDRVVGGYVRGQLALSLLAGLLGGAGAAFLGVPYPLLIGIVTFFLESIPVIGPMVAVVPAVAIALFFTSIPTTVALFVWFMVFQQVVTNILGPRILGSAVGIHPLEALFAVLVGYPVGGFLGAFLAVPVMGVIHILIREAYAYLVLGRAMPAEPSPISIAPEERAAEPAPPPGAHPVRPQPTRDSAAG